MGFYTMSAHILQSVKLRFPMCTTGPFNKCIPEELRKRVWRLNADNSDLQITAEILGARPRAQLQKAVANLKNQMLWVAGSLGTCSAHAVRRATGRATKGRRRGGMQDERRGATASRLNGGGGGKGLGGGAVAKVEASAAAASEAPAAGGAGTIAGCPRCGWCMSRSVEARMMVLGAAGPGVARRAF